MHILDQTIVVLMGMRNQHGIHGRLLPGIQSFHPRQHRRLHQFLLGQTIIIPHVELAAIWLHQRHTHIKNNTGIACGQFHTTAADFMTAAMYFNFHS